MKSKPNRTGGTPLVALFVSVCLMGLSALASTCIVSYPSGDRDPKSSLASGTVSVDAGAGTAEPLQSWLESRFVTFDVSPGIALTTMPLGMVLSIQ